MSQTIPARVGTGLSVHATQNGTVLCGAGRKTNSRVLLAEDHTITITCKSCLKALAAQGTRILAEQDASQPVEAPEAEQTDPAPVETPEPDDEPLSDLEACIEEDRHNAEQADGTAELTDLERALIASIDAAVADRAEADQIAAEEHAAQEAEEAAAFLADPGPDTLNPIGSEGPRRTEHGMTEDATGLIVGGEQRKKPKKGDPHPNQMLMF